MKHPMDLHRSRRLWRDWDDERAILRQRRRRRGRKSVTGLLGLALLVALAALGGTMIPSPAELAMDSAPETTTMPYKSGGRMTAPERVNFGICHRGGGRNCVVDGDTFWMNGVKIRIADIDTPETHPARCTREGELGAAATRRLQTLLSSGPVSLAPIDRDADRYGRKLRLVSVGTMAVGEMLIEEGLARRYEGGRRAGWCD